MDIERYVASKWDENVSKVKKGGSTNSVCSLNVDKSLAAEAWGEINVNSTLCVVLAIQSGVGVNLVKFSVQFVTKLFDARVNTSSMLLALLAFILYLRFGTL